MINAREGRASSYDRTYAPAHGRRADLAPYLWVDRDLERSRTAARCGVGGDGHGPGSPAQSASGCRGTRTTDTDDIRIVRTPIGGDVGSEAHGGPGSTVAAQADGIARRAGITGNGDRGRAYSDGRRSGETIVHRSDCHAGTAGGNSGDLSGSVDADEGCIGTGPSRRSGDILRTAIVEISCRGELGCTTDLHIRGAGGDGYAGLRRIHEEVAAAQAAQTHHRQKGN